MPVGPIPPVGPAVGALPGAPSAAASSPAAPGFGAAVTRGLQQVSDLEQQANTVTQSLASGGGAHVHDLMIATTKAQLGVDLLVAVRNRAVEAYQEIMRMQV